ncbi:hypothetical protein SteCoe_14975 [Stentor coeruleus]|uniref:Uncharacterized protein n=1 Tax=Stentor coeruleus TaxID=5963 RepID=A0A1R2C4U1_9CILI|nr:hypothetical protein SteCoe_14975 [Stentor coeruleus]
MIYSKIIRYSSTLAEAMSHQDYTNLIINSKTISSLVNNFNPNLVSWQSTLHIKALGSIIREYPNQIYNLSMPACQQIIDDSLNKIEKFTYQEFTDVLYFLRNSMYLSYLPYNDTNIKKIIEYVEKPITDKPNFKPLCSLAYQLSGCGIFSKNLWSQTMEHIKKERYVRITDLKEILFAFSYNSAQCENIWINILENASNKVIKCGIKTNLLIDYYLKYEQLCAMKSRPVNQDIASLVKSEIVKVFNKNSFSDVSSLMESLKMSNTFEFVYEDYIKKIGSASHMNNDFFIENLSEYTRLKNFNKELAEGMIKEIDIRFNKETLFESKKIKKVVVALKKHNLPFKDYQLLLSDPKISSFNASNFFIILAIVPELTQKSLLNLPAYDSSKIKFIRRFDMFKYFLLMNSLGISNEETELHKKNVLKAIDASTSKYPFLTLPIVKECVNYSHFAKLPVFKEIYDLCFPRIPENIINKDNYKAFL